MPRRQVRNFPSDFYCNKNIIIFFLQISRSEQLLKFVPNMKRYINANQELEKATAVWWKSMFYVHHNFCAQDYCDDWWCIWVQHLSGFMLTHQLQSVVVKQLLNRKCIANFKASQFFYSSSNKSTFYCIVYSILRALWQYKNFSSVMFIMEVKGLITKEYIAMHAILFSYYYFA